MKKNSNFELMRTIIFIIFLSLPFGESWRGVAQNKFTATPSVNNRTIPAYLLGVNGAGIDSVRLTDVLLNDLIYLSPEHIRYPGGTIANYWDWRMGKSKGKPQKFKLEDLKTAIDSTRSKPLFVLNMLDAYYLGYDTTTLDTVNLALLPDQIAMLDSAAKIGLNIQDIELGNELSYRQYDTGIYDSVAQYISTCQNWIDSIKNKLGDTLKISVVGFERPWQGQPRQKQWNDSIFKAINNNSLKADAISFHTYVEYEALDSMSVITCTNFTNKLNLIKQIRKTYTTIDSFNTNVMAKLPTSEAWISEFNLRHDGVDVNNAYMGTWIHGLLNAFIPILHLREAKITKLTYHDISGVFAAIFPGKKGFPICYPDSVFSLKDSLSASGYTLQLLNNALEGMDGGTITKIDFNGNNNSTIQENGIFGMKLQKANDERAVLMNLNAEPDTIDVSDLFCSAEWEITSLYVDSPLAFINEQTSMLQPTHPIYTNTDGKIILPPYSILLLKANPSVALSFDIDGNQNVSGTWDSNMRVRGTMTIQNGNTLEINNGAVIQFAENSGIVVEKGAKLITDNATLTALMGCSNVMWNGILSLGDVEIKSSSTTSDAVIENAHTALQLGGKTVCQSCGDDCEGCFTLGAGTTSLQNTTFRNNNVSVYSPTNSIISGLPATDISNCSFVCNAPLKDVQKYNGNGSQNFILNSNATTETKITGSTFTSSFDMTAVVSNASRPFTITGCTFDKISRGIYIQGGNADIFANDSFINIPSANNTDNYGIYMVGCTGFDIKKNTFSGNGESGNTPAPLGDLTQKATYGIVIENTATNAGRVFRNTFNGLDFQMQAQEDNGALGIRCNNFNNAGTMAWVTFDSLKQQGKSCDGTVNGLIITNQLQAGNEWDSCKTTSIFSDIYYNDKPFQYFAHEGDKGGHPNITNPENCTNLQVILKELNVCTDVNKTDSSCADYTISYAMKINDCNDYITALKMEIQKLENEISGAKAQIKHWQHQEHIIDRINRKPPIADQPLKDFLMQELPENDQSLIALLRRKQPLAPQMLADILVLNSPLSSDVIGIVRELPIPPNARNRIEAAQFQKPYFLRTRQLQELIAYDEVEIQLLENEILRTMEDCNGRQKVREHLIERPIIEHKKLLSGIYMSEGNFADARNLLNTIQLMTDTIWWADTSAKLKTKKENDNFCKLMNCLISHNEQTNSSSSSLPFGESWSGVSLQTIREVAQSKTQVSYNAEALLTAITGEKFVHPIKKIQMQNIRGKESSENIKIEQQSFISEQQFRIYPNPANTQLMIDCGLKGENQRAVFLLHDIWGRQISRFELDCKNKNVSINTSDLPNGIYIYTYQVDKEIKDRGKITILK